MVKSYSSLLSQVECYSCIIKTKLSLMLIIITSDEISDLKFFNVGES